MTLRIMGAETESSASKVGQSAHAEGQATVASGPTSHAEGSNSVASNSSSHAEGNGTTASGFYAHSEGTGTLASGNSSHAEGSSGTASGNASHVEGVASIASGYASHAGGYNSTSNAYGQWSRKSAPISARSQISIYHMGMTSSTATARTLTFDGATSIVTTGTNQNVYVIPYKSAVTFQVHVVGRYSGVGSNGQQSGFQITGMVVRDATGNARVIGTPTVISWNDTSSLGTVALVIVTTDADNNYLAVQATPAINGNTAWTGFIIANELTTGN